MIIQTAFNPSAPDAAPSRVALPESGGASATGRPAAAAEQAATTAPSRQQLQRAVDTANNAPKFASYSLSFSMNDKTDQVVIKLVDKESGEVIRQIPPKEMLAIAESIEQAQKGLLLSQEA